MKSSVYFKQTELLLRILPIINREKNFALKGGTAINFFVRNFPRLSVDIDLAFLPVKSRIETLLTITKNLKIISESIHSSFSNVLIIERKIKNTQYLSGLQVKRKDALIKIEANTVFRGSVYKPDQLTLCKKVSDLFEMSLKANCLSLPDLFGGKICAALDRQHPRDLFDVKLLFENEGFSDKIKKAFIVYLISHERPIIELLNPNEKDISTIFDQEFRGMTNKKIELKELTDTFSNLKETIITSLNESEKEFLLSFKRMKPNWELSGLKNIHKLPSVKWKLLNLKQMDKKKHKDAYRKLEKFLK